MSFINSRAKEINCKVIYYGAPASGKSTTLKHVYQKLSDKKDSLLTLSEERDGSLFFDFLPLSLGKVNNYNVRFHVYTVPGQTVYDSSRKIILKGVDGVIFVVDSQIERMDVNLESWKSLENHLKLEGTTIESLPLTFQYNKRDLKTALPVAELQALFNPTSLPEFETVATKGQNVLECFQAIAKSVLKNLKG